MSTGYCVGTVLAILLNVILPEDAPNEDDDEIGTEKPLQNDVTGHTGQYSSGKKLSDSSEGDVEEAAEEVMEEDAVEA